MSTTIANVGSDAVTVQRSRPSYQAYQILRLGYTVAPLLAVGASALWRLAQESGD